MMRSILKSGAAALTVGAMAIAPATIATFASVTTAEAQKGGNGNGNGNARSQRGNNGNGSANREASNRGSNGRGNNGRGAIASELKGLNAAHASPTALANASPDSMPGKLYTYQQATLAASQADALVQEKGDLYAALQGMSEERFNELNPDLDYASTLATTGAEYQAALDAQTSAATNTEQSLAVLTGGSALSEAAMAELNALLGL